MDEISLGDAKIFALGWAAIVAQVDVLAPIEFQNAVLGPFVVGASDRIPRFIPAGGEEV
jgi:hypothetical protein